MAMKIFVRGLAVQEPIWMDIDDEITVAALTRAIQAVLQLDVSVSLSLSTFDRERDAGNLSLAEAGNEDGMTVVADEVVTADEAEADEADEADEVVTVPRVAAAEADGQRRRMRRMAERLWNKIERLEERVAVAEGVAAGATRAAVQAKVLAEAAAAAVAADGWRARSREELGRRAVAEAEVAVWRNWWQVVDLDTEAARWRGWPPP